MLSEKEVQLLRRAIRSFIEKELEGRFREYVSDDFLLGILMVRLREERYGSPDNSPSRGRYILDRDHVSANAYEVACKIFETVLEHGCRSGGNGHHVAQDFAAWMDKKFPKQQTSNGS